MGYTFEQLQQMGAKPVVNTASLEPKKYTFEELQGLGAKPVDNATPVESNKYGIAGKYISNLGSQYKDTAEYLMNLPTELKAPSINASESFLPQLGSAALTAGRQVAKGVSKGVGAIFAPVTALAQTAVPETEQEKLTGKTGFLKDIERGVVSGLPFGPGGAITGGVLGGGFNLLNKGVSELESKYPETFKANPSLKEDINNVAMTLLSLSPGLLPAGKSVPGTDILNTSVSNYPKALVESYKPITQTVGAGIKKITPKPEEIMNRVARLSPNEAKQFKNIAKESHGEYLKKTGNFGTPKEIVEREAVKFSNSLQETDNALAQLKGTYKSPYIDMVVNDLVKRESEIGVPNSESLKINNLFQKNSKEGLTMKEINEAKRIYERNVKLGYYKEQNTIGIARSTRLDSALREWQFKKAKELGLKNLDKLNKQTQISKFIVNKLGRQIDGRTGNNAITLTDWIVLSKGDPTSIGAFLTKKLLTSKKIQSGFAKMLSGKPERDIKAQYEKPAQLMELPAGRQIDLPEPGVLRGQQNLRTIPQTSPIEQPLQELLPKQLRKTSSTDILPQKVEKAIVKKDFASLEEYNQEISKQIESFRKEAGLMASNEGAGVRQYVSDQTGGENRTYNYFKLDRAKSDMHQRAESAKKYAQEMMYENNPDFRELVDKRDQLLNNKIDTSTNEIDVKAIFDDISREESKINEANKELGAFNEVKNVETKSSQENATTTKKEIELPKKSFVKKIVETYKNNPERGAIANPLSNVSKKIISEGEQKPTLQLKRDVTVTTLTGEKAVIDAGEVLKAYEQGGKALLKDGREYIVSKSQYENIKNNSLKSEAKPFAPELKTTEETTLGAGSSKPIEWTPSETGVKTTYNGKTYITSKEGTKYLTREVGGRGALGTGEGHRTLEKAKSFAEDYIKESPNKQPKYSQYQLPEGKNYKEILIKTPEISEGAARQANADKIAKELYGKTHKELWDNGEMEKWDNVSKLNKVEYGNNFKSSHWEEPNVISHLRMNERTYKGKKVTFMEELQSDWARELRNTEKLISEGDNSTVVAKRLKNLQNPLLKNWQELSIKRALKEAVDNGSDYFAWINGDQTSARYNLATQIEKVSWREGIGKIGSGNKSVALTPKSGGTRNLDIIIDFDKTGKIFDGGGDMPGDWVGKKLDEVIGKGLADKIMSEDKGTLSGEGLKFGGEWANNLYDKQVKNIVEDLTGHKVEVIDMGLPIDKKVQRFFNQKTFKEIKPSELKVGLEISSAERGGFGADNYIITDILGDGKFKAVPKSHVDAVVKDPNGRYKTPEKAIAYLREVAPTGMETFDISQKTTTQQAIKITPEIRAMVKGEAPKLLPSKKPPIKSLPVKNTDPLISEAKKYKSADEFVKAQGEVLYHGTPSGFETKDFRGGYLTADKNYADVYKSRSASSISYGAEGVKNKASGIPRTLEFVVKKDANLFDYTNPKHRALLKDYFGKSSMSSEPAIGKSGQLDWTEGENLREFFDENGIKFDGIKLDEAGGFDPISGLEVKRSPSVLVINPKVLTEKSQLTDIWKKANKKQPIKELPKKR